MLSRFQPPWWALLLASAGLLLFVVLGTWQLNRGLDKQAHALRFANPEPARIVLARGVRAGGAMQRAQASGEYLGKAQLLADGHARGGRPGFEVWTPLRLADGALALVNRGWVPQPARLDELEAPSAPEGPVRIQGWWRTLPEPGIRTQAPPCERAAGFPVQVVYPLQTQVECLLGEPVLAGLLLLDATEPGGFVREWSPGGLSPQRHFGYAVTWYALGVTALVLFLKLNLRPRS